MGFKSRVIRVKGIPIVSQEKPIDLYLADEDNKRVYELWGDGIKRFHWEEPITYRGGVKSITCDMVKRIPVEELEKLFYKKRTQRILEAIEQVG